MKKIGLFLITITMTLVFSACDNKTNKKENAGENGNSSEKVNETGFPIVDESITFEMFTQKSPQNIDHDWNDLMLWNE